MSLQELQDTMIWYFFVAVHRLPRWRIIRETVTALETI